MLRNDNIFSIFCEKSQLHYLFADKSAVSKMLEQYTSFAFDYWPVIVTGIMCFLAAAVLLKTSLENSADDLPPDSDFLDDTEFESEFDDEKITEMSGFPTELKYVDLKFQRFTPKESELRSTEFFDLMDKRRTVRYFSQEPVSIKIVHNIIRAAGTAPSGAHTEPWTYVVVKDPKVKTKLKEIVESEEKFAYIRKTGGKLKVDNDKVKLLWEKEYLTRAPYLILVFKQLYSIQGDGTKLIHHYNEMSVAIAAGILLTAIHYAGLVSLASTPINCGPEIREILNRPINEKLALLVPIGYPAQDATVPDLTRKPLNEIMVEV